MRAVKGIKDIDQNESTGVAGIAITSGEGEPIKMEPKHEKLHESLALGLDHIIGTEITPRYKKWGGFHASNTNSCQRYMYYLFNGIEVPPDHGPRTQRIFDNGHAMHERYNIYFEKMGIVLASEQPIWNDDPPIESTLDLIIDWGGPKIVELKSINDGGFIYRRVAGAPKDDHYRQIQMYMKVTGIHEGYVIYENKNDQEILVFPVSLDEVFIEKLWKKLRKIYKAVQDDVKPVRPYKQSGEKCQRCPLREHCWNVDTEEGVKI
jgi:CRISPR/Cas system-associated exonuclease Cas4 (RecB family)